MIKVFKKIKNKNHDNKIINIRNIKKLITKKIFRAVILFI